MIDKEVMQYGKSKIWYRRYLR